MDLIVKSLKSKLLIASSLIMFSFSAYADEYLCSYTARISPADKYNSSGSSLTQHGYSNAVVASILRQDRANFYLFNKADAEDERDCAFRSKDNRAIMQRFLSNGSIPQYAKQVIIDETPLVQVKVYRHHIDVDILQNNNRTPKSSIQ